MRFHRRRFVQVCATVAIALIWQPCLTARAQSAQRAATPPMDWNSWNHFADKVTDADVRAAADAMVASGMRDAGYIYVNIDDSWEGQRDAQGNIHSNSRFPDMNVLGDDVHSKGKLHDPHQDPQKALAMMQEAYGKMHQALVNTHRSIVYSLCQYGVDSVWEWGRKVGGSVAHNR